MTSIGLDLGTGAIKGVCWNQEKGVLKKVSERVSFCYPGSWRVELDVEVYKQQIFRLIKDLAEASQEEICAISFAAASGNTLLCDADGEALTPIISWLDKRLEDWLPPEKWQVRQSTGWPAIPTFPLMHLEYFRREKSELLNSAHVAMNNDWIAWQLCGTHQLDRSNAAPFYFWNQEQERYENAYLEYYGITRKQLPEIVPTGTVSGTLKKELCRGNLTVNTRIVAGSFDHPAGARAVKVFEPGEMLLSCGTSWVGFYPCRKRDDVPFNELCDTYQSAAGGCWGAMFSIPEVGVEIERFICDRFGNCAERYEKFNAEAQAGDTPSRKVMCSVIDRFKTRFDEHSGIRRVVISGGPSEGRMWIELLREKLGIQIDVAPWHSYTGAVGAAQIAGAVVK